MVNVEEEVEKIVNTSDSETMKKIKREIEEKRDIISTKKQILRRQGHIFSEIEKRAIRTDMKRKEESIKHLQEQYDKKSRYHLSQGVDNLMTKIAEETFANLEEDEIIK